MCVCVCERERERERERETGRCVVILRSRSFSRVECKIVDLTAALSEAALRLLAKTQSCVASGRTHNTNRPCH